MGHFGSRPIRRAWFALVKPALVVAYLGQAAMVINEPETAENPLYALAPNRTWTIIMLVFATLATIIAAQALITGVYSLTRQAVQLGYFPRVRITAHLGPGRGSDLHPGDQLDADGGLHLAGPAVPDLREPGGGLRGRGVRDDGHHLDRVLRRGRAHLGVAPPARRSPGVDVPGRRPVVPGRDAAQVLAGRLRPDRHRRGRGPRHVHLAPRDQHPAQPRGGAPADVGGGARRDRGRKHPAHAGHGCLPGLQPRRRPAEPEQSCSAAPQPARARAGRSRS